MWYSTHCLEITIWVILLPIIGVSILLLLLLLLLLLFIIHIKTSQNTVKNYLHGPRNFYVLEI